MRQHLINAGWQAPRPGVTVDIGLEPVELVASVPINLDAGTRNRCAGRVHEATGEPTELEGRAGASTRPRLADAALVRTRYDLERSFALGPSTLSVVATFWRARGGRLRCLQPEWGQTRPAQDISTALRAGPTAYEARLAFTIRKASRSNLPLRYATALKLESESPNGVAPVKMSPARPPQTLRRFWTALITDRELRPVNWRRATVPEWNAVVRVAAHETSMSLLGCTSRQSRVTAPMEPAT